MNDLLTLKPNISVTITLTSFDCIFSEYAFIYSSFYLSSSELELFRLYYEIAVKKLAR